MFLLWRQDRIRDAEKGDGRARQRAPKTAAQPVKEPRAMNLINSATWKLMLFMLRVLRMDHWDKSLLLNAEGQPTAKGLLSNQLTRYLLWETVPQKTPWALIVVHLSTFHFKDFAHSWILSLLFFSNFLHYAKLIADKIYEIAVSCHCSVISSLWMSHSRLIHLQVCLSS